LHSKFDVFSRKSQLKLVKLSNNGKCTVLNEHLFNKN
jgi:hypothetical protein